MPVHEFTEAITKERSLLDSVAALEPMAELAELVSYPEQLELQAFYSEDINYPTRLIALKEGYEFVIALRRTADIADKDRSHFYGQVEAETTKENLFLDGYEAVLQRLMVYGT